MIVQVRGGLGHREDIVNDLLSLSAKEHIAQLDKKFAHIFQSLE